jgi:membrane protease YdiL (CAAX protease family)
VLTPVALPVFAPGFGQSYDLPLYLYGAAAAVLVSFAPISLFAGRSGTGEPYPRFDLLRIRPLRAVSTVRAFLFGLLSVALSSSFSAVYRANRRRTTTSPRLSSVSSGRWA